MVYILMSLIYMLVFINQLMNKEKRFQEVNKIEQLWRYRYYIPIPFLWIWYSVFGLKVYEDEWNENKLVRTNNFRYCKGKDLFKLLIGMQQEPMKWYYTSDEVFEKYKNRDKC